MTPATDERLTIEPPPLCFIARTASRQPRNAPSALIALTLRQSSSVVVSILPRTATPALLTRISSRPNAARTASTTARQRASSVTSCASVRSASAPSVFKPVSLRPVTTTVAPSAWNRAAVARPMPDAAPVMSATLPARRPALALSIVSSPVQSQPRFSACRRETPIRPPPLARRALFAEMGDRLLESGRRHAKDAGIGQPEFEDEKQSESDAGGAGGHGGDDKGVRFRKDPEGEEQRNRPEGQNSDQTRTHGTPCHLEGHQQARLCDLVGEGADGGESLLLLFGRRGEGAEEGFYSPPRGERNGYGQAFRIGRPGTPEGVVGLPDRCFQSFARERPGRPQLPKGLVEFQYIGCERIKFGLLGRLEGEACAHERSEDERKKKAQLALERSDDDPR